MDKKNKVLLILVSGLILTAIIGYGGEDVTHGFYYEDVYRYYTVHIPTQYDEADNLALMLNLHGYGGSGAGHMVATKMNATSDAETFLVAYPEGLGLPRAWEYPRDVGYLEVVIDNIAAQYRVDTARIYISGFSNGAWMSHVMACELSEKLTAIAPVCGGLFKTDWSEIGMDKPVPTMFFFARDDPAIPYDGEEDFPGVEEMVESWAVKQGCAEESDSFYSENNSLRKTRYNSDTTVQVVLWTTEGGGHGWPSIESDHGISANDLMWEFFSGYPKEKEPDPGCEELVDQINLPCFKYDYGSGRIQFSLNNGSWIKIVMFDVLGRETHTLADGFYPQGKHQIDTGSYQSGVYFCRLTTTVYSQTLKIVK